MANQAIIQDLKSKINVLSQPKSLEAVFEYSDEATDCYSVFVHYGSLQKIKHRVRTWADSDGLRHFKCDCAESRIGRHCSHVAEVGRAIHAKFMNDEAISAAIEKLLSERPNNASFARAVKRARQHLENSPFWSYDGKTLWILSPVSGNEYRGITGERCVCESWLANHGFCWHRAAYLILKKMSENTEEGDKSLQQTLDEISKEFGLEPITLEEHRAWEKNYEARLKNTQTELAAFCSSLPKWVKDEDHFMLFLMTNAEREKWFEENSPYLKPTADKKRERLGGVRF
jgi:hypothetical protein